MSSAASGTQASNRCFSSIADGDRIEFSRLYDQYAADTFGQCSAWSATSDDSSAAMVEVWLFLWSNAATLADDRRSTSEIVRASANAVIQGRVMRKLLVS